MERIIKRVFLTCCGVAVGLVLAACVWPGRFGYRSVCSVCGLESRNTELRFGLVETGLAWTQEFETNGMSAVLGSRPELANHRHMWIFAAGGGAGVKCAIGDGRHLWQAVRSTNAAAFLTELAKAGDSKSILLWRDRLLNPEQSRDAVIAIASAGDDRDEAQTWPMTAEAIFQDLQPTKR